MGHPEPSDDDLVSEFVHLNRRRVFGLPPLAVTELERWQELRRALEQRLGDRLQSLLATVERRTHFRFATHLEVRFATGDELRSACLGNISEGGIFVATERPLPAGTALRLTIIAPSGRVEMAGPRTGRTEPPARPSASRPCRPSSASASPRSWRATSRAAAAPRRARRLPAP